MVSGRGTGSALKAKVRSTARMLLGSLAWLLAVQFFVVQVIVAAAWPAPFSLTARHISDLGNTVCGPYPAGSANIVCSPWHAAMNASFILIGTTMAAGAILTRRWFGAGWQRELAVILFTLAGVGVVLVGLYPENENSARHVFGAGINFISGNVALILFGLAVPHRSPSPLFTGFSIVAGALGLIGVVLFVSDVFLGLGSGGMERIAAYPMAVWQIVAGIILWRRAELVA